MFLYFIMNVTSVKSLAADGHQVRGEFMLEAVTQYKDEVFDNIL